MTRPDRSRLDDPTAEDAADMSTQTASGLTSGRTEEERDRAEDNDVSVPTQTDREAPRRYEQPADADPVMPSEDSSLNTKI
jgi:hypothetical protein